MHSRTSLVFLATALAACAFAGTASAAVVDCSQFSRNLKVGMTGQDVKALQVLLNSQAATRIAESGPGSSGNETSYFGMMTKSAVTRFQELHASEVLSPVGLTKGTGFFGASTRAKARVVCGSPAIGKQTVPSAPVVQPITPVTPRPATPPPSTVVSTNPDYYKPLLVSDLIPSALMVESTKGNPYVTNPESYTAKAGDTVTIIGGGFSSTGNTVRIGTQSFAGLKPTADGVLMVTLPPTMPSGKHDLWFENTKGTSNKSFVIVTKPGSTPPSVTAFTPSTGPNGTVVTVTGERFTNQNDIYVGAEVIKGVSSPDGKKLTFTATLPIPSVTGSAQAPAVSASVPLWFYIVNENGISENQVFTVTF